MKGNKDINHCLIRINISSKIKDLGCKVSCPVELWYLSITIVLSGHTYLASIMSMAYRKSTFHDLSHINALGIKVDLIPNPTYQAQGYWLFGLQRRHYMGVAAILVM